MRNTRAWPLVRPVYRFARRVIPVDSMLGRSSARPAWARLEVEQIRRRLRNLGFTERALAELREAAADEMRPYLRRLAAAELALWYADQYREDDARKSLEFLKVAALGEDDRATLRQLAVMRAECYQRIGQAEAAWAAISRALADRPGPDLFLAAASLEPVAQRRVEWINRALVHRGLSEIGLADPVTGAPFDHLSAGGHPQAVAPDGPVVTVIVPAYNAVDTIRTALAALLAQTWPHLEVLVVDDASTDATAEVVAEYEQRDPRVRLIRAERNGGTYVARNLALREATGELVTCHDTDDWSHPEKIERQVRHLLEHPEVIANTSEQARVTPDLIFHRRGKLGYFLFPNLSSLMFRRTVVMDALGFWDCVRFGADAELQRRIKRAFGEQALVNLRTGPLCLQRQSSDSLTGNQAFGYHGFFMGARRDYFETYNYFQRVHKDLLRYEFPEPARRFPVPTPMLPDRPSRAQRRHFDVIIASDFRLVGGSTMSSLEELKAHARLGLRTGLVQMAYYDVDSRRVVASKVRDVIDGDRVQMLVHGEQVSCDLLIVRYPPVLDERQRYLPDVAPEQVRVIVNQPPMSDYGPDGVVRYRIENCHENLLKYYGQAGVWHPIGPLVRQALHQHHGDELSMIDLSDQDWVNVIDVDAWRRPARPPRGQRPRIGRHSRDSLVKWPATADELRTVYPDSPEYEVHVLGGAKSPVSILGHLPENWRVREFGEMTPAEFLTDIDVFVYYPNPDWVESFGRVILEAMAAGVPVVLPPTFQPLFGDAAIYAEPAGALAQVDQLMQDDDYYSTRLELAQRFVEDTFGYSRHAERVGRFVKR